MNAIPITTNPVWGWVDCIDCGDGHVTVRGLVLLIGTEEPTLARIGWCSAATCLEDRGMTNYLAMSESQVALIDGAGAL